MNKSTLLALALVPAALLLLSAAKAPKVGVKDLTTELRTDPEGIDCETPRFSWKVDSRENKTLQTAYQITVWRGADGKKVWDSGKVPSFENVLVPYGGPALESETDYEWAVKVWTSAGVTRDETRARWSTGLRDSAAWMGAKWIGISEREKLKEDPCHLPARYLRKDFRAGDKIASAKLYMSALGIGDASINGKRVCPQMFMHPPVLFDKVVYYRTYDVTSLVQKGDNTLAVLLGCGRYQSLSAKTLRSVSDPRVKLVLKIRYKDGRQDVVISDTDWTGTSGGPVTSNNEYDGEYYDARLEMPGWNTVGFKGDRRWKSVDEMGAPKGRMRAMTMDDMAIQDKIMAQSVRKVGRDRYIVDFGQNMVGYVIMTLEGKAGQPIVFKYAEKLTDAGDSLNMASLRRTLATDQYTPASDGKFTWTPTFPMHGFRFMEIEGVTATPINRNLVGQVIWDKMDPKGSFECSDERLNRLYKNIRCGLRSNYRGMPIDCPQRDERQGWIGDRGGTIWGEPYLFNVAPLYRKWMDDVYDSMKNGQRISVVSPRYWSIYTDDMSHSSVFLYMAEMLYSRYGDDSGIRTYYPAMKAWLEYATAKNLKEDGIFRMKHDEYKDWIVPPESPELIHATDPSRITNSPVLQTGILVGTLDLMMKFARLTGNDADVPFYEGMKARVVEAYNREFFDPERNCYDNNTLTANLIPVYFDIVPAAHKQAVVENIVNRIENDFDGHLCVGNVGMRYVMEVLTRNGHADLAYKLCTIDTYPSWGYMIKKGATTVWELWNGDEAGPSMNSGCHAHLIGDLLRWYYEDLAGIAPEPTASGIIAAAPAFRRIWMQPCFPEGLDHVKASFDSPQGTISSEWTIIGHKIVWRIEIPVGSTATVVAPARFNLNPGKLASYTEGGTTKIFLPSGKYILQSK